MSDLMRRISIAIRRITDGGAAMSIPVQDTDVDVVLTDCGNELARLREENERLNNLMVHCENCGGDYAATGLEVGCSCLLLARVAELEDLLRRSKLGEPDDPHACWCQVSIGNPMMDDHDDLCKDIRAALGEPEEDSNE